MRSGGSLLARPVTVRGRTFPPPLLVLLAAVGATFILGHAAPMWAEPRDDLAYWLAGRRIAAGDPIYEGASYPGDLYRYWYPPVFAQAIAPATLLLPAGTFGLAWIALLLGCLWWLGGRSILGGLAIAAFPPVAVELGYRNVHLVVAVLIVVAIRRSPVAWVAVAAIEASPAIALAHVLLRGARRAALRAALVGAAVLGLSVLISPAAWLEFVREVLTRAPTEVSTFLGVPYPVRLAAGAALVVAAARLRPSLADPLLVVGIVLALPTLWGTALSTLVALVPLLRERRETDPGTVRPRDGGAPSPRSVPRGRSGQRPSGR